MKKQLTTFAMAVLAVTAVAQDDTQELTLCHS